MIKTLGITEKEINENWSLVKNSDHISAAGDRFTFPENISSDFLSNPKLNHPIDGNNLTWDLISLQTRVDITKIKETMNNILVNGTRNFGSFKDKFLYIWRYLNRDLKKDNYLGVLWDVLPADTRIPNHSIWHHNRIASAYVGAKYKDLEVSLVLMSIGPVQGFINTARTTADFWAGSYLLSYLSWKGMEVFANEIGPDTIIFPDLKGQPLVDKWLEGINQNLKSDNTSIEMDVLRPSLPNKWLVICPQNEAENLAKEAEKNIRKEWKKIKQEVFKQINLPGDLIQSFEKQDEFLEVYWSILDLDEINNKDEVLNNYKNFMPLPQNFEEFLKSNIYTPNEGTFFPVFQSAIDRIMGARKSIRFNILNSEEKGYKCTLCGTREVIHDNTVNSDEYSKIKSYWGSLSKDINEKFPLAIKKGEMLCSVCLTKRILGKKPKEILGFGKDISFPSLTEIAVADFKYQVLEKTRNNQELKELVKKGICRRIE